MSDASYRWNIRGIDKFLIRRARILALQQERKVAEVVNDALEAYLEVEEQREEEAR
jgi:hypothetical protein